jgi:hypothetical protein
MVEMYENRKPFFGDLTEYHLQACSLHSLLSPPESADC